MVLSKSFFAINSCKFIACSKNPKDFCYGEHWLLEKLGLELRIARESLPDYVSDGCSINFIAYTIAKFGSDFRKRQDFQELERKALAHAKKYDLIIYIPIEIPLERNQTRPKSLEFREFVDRMILEELKPWEYHTVRGSLEERVERVRRIVGIYQR